jgi:tetratricopeptide (TPR) repeat protein
MSRRRCVGACAVIAIFVLASIARADDTATCAQAASNVPKEAIAACGRLLQSETINEVDQAIYFNNRGLAYTRIGVYDQALRDLDASLRLNPNIINAHINRGLVHLYKRQYDLAIADFDYAIRLDPNNANAYHGRGFSYLRKNEYDRAIVDFNQAIQITPNSDSGYSDRGSAWLEKRQFRRALDDFDQAIKLNPNSAVARANRARALRETGELERALLDYNAAIKLDPSFPSAIAGRGLVWRLKKDFDRAVGDYNKAILLNPALPEPYTARGQIYEEKGDVESAKRDYATALSKSTGAAISISGSLPVIDLSGERFKAIARARLAVLAQQQTETTPAAASMSKVSSGSESVTGVSVDRIALVIGNGAYPELGALPNPPNDARAMAKALRALGFDVIEGINLDHEAFEHTVRDFLLKAVNARMALLFYAGHGIQFDDHNFLVPVDTKIIEGNDLTRQMTSLDTILSALDDQVRTNIVILDACRINPLASSELVQAKGIGRSITVRAGLAAPTDLGKGATLGAGTLIAFATAPGQVALDGEGGNSPFSTALLRHLPTQGLEVQTMLTRVRADVVASTRSQQVPWSNSSLLGEVYLAGKP